MLRPCSSEIDDGLSLARQYGGRDVDKQKVVFYYELNILCSNGSLIVSSFLAGVGRCANYLN